MMPEEAAAPQPRWLTPGQLRQHIRKVRREKDKMLRERVHLEYGSGVIAQRIESLLADERACLDSITAAQRALDNARNVPRGKTIIATALDYPEYNPHQRLAVMERSFL